jgi:hypothetical protein
MALASVPKATIDEDGEFGARKNEIGFSGERIIPAPTRDVVRAKNGNQTQLCVFIAPAFYQRHHVRALFLGKNVRHSEP